MKSPTIFPLIVADIGGTNARFGIATGAKSQNQRLIIEQQKVYACSDFNSFETLFKNYLSLVSSIKGLFPKHACIAIAAPIVKDTITMTNLDWSFSSNALCLESNMKKVHFINDFGALAYATLSLKPSELKTIYSSKTPPSASQARAIIGPGTGLGIAGLVYTPSGWHPVCGEGGHVSFAPTTALQHEIKSTLTTTLNTQHISVENLLSGPGLVNLYQAICIIHNTDINSYTAKEISELAITKSDEYCVTTLKVFTQILGASAGDVALSMGAFGGVYLSGGILPKIIDAIDTKIFKEHYLNKGVKQGLLESIPVYLVNTPLPALTGAAHYMFDLEEQ